MRQIHWIHLNPWRKATAAMLYKCCATEALPPQEGQDQRPTAWCRWQCSSSDRDDFHWPQHWWRGMLCRRPTQGARWLPHQWSALWEPERRCSTASSIWYRVADLQLHRLRPCRRRHTPPCALLQQQWLSKRQTIATSVLWIIHIISRIPLARLMQLLRYTRVGDLIASLHISKQNRWYRRVEGNSRESRNSEEAQVRRFICNRRVWGIGSACSNSFDSFLRQRRLD